MNENTSKSYLQKDADRLIAENKIFQVGNASILVGTWISINEDGYIFGKNRYFKYCSIENHELETLYNSSKDIYSITNGIVYADSKKENYRMPLISLE